MADQTEELSQQLQEKEMELIYLRASLSKMQAQQLASSDSQDDRLAASTSYTPITSSATTSPSTSAGFPSATPNMSPLPGIPC